MLINSCFTISQRGMSEPPKQGRCSQQIFWGFLNLKFSKSTSSFLSKFVGSANSRNLKRCRQRSHGSTAMCCKFLFCRFGVAPRSKWTFFLEIFSCECRMWMGGLNGLNGLGWWDSLAGWVFFFIPRLWLFCFRKFEGDNPNLLKTFFV